MLGIEKRNMLSFGMSMLICAGMAGCGGQAASGAPASEPALSVSEPSSAVSEPAPPSSETSVAPQAVSLADGVYSADFDTDSGMFRVNETLKGKGVLTVKDGEMVIHVTLSSKNIVNLFPGLADDAKKDGAKWLEPTEDTVTYSDGISEQVNGFDVPVPYLDEEFDLALLGAKGKWYDHKVSVSNPEEQGKTE